MIQNADIMPSLWLYLQAFSLPWLAVKILIFCLRSKYIYSYSNECRTEDFTIMKSSSTKYI